MRKKERGAGPSPRAVRRGDGAARAKGGAELVRLISGRLSAIADLLSPPLSHIKLWSIASPRSPRALRACGGARMAMTGARGQRQRSTQRFLADLGTPPAVKCGSR